MPLSPFLRPKSIFAIPEDVFSFTLHQFRIQSWVKLLDNGSSGLLPVSTEPTFRSGKKQRTTISLYCRPRRRIAECEPFGSVQEGHSCIHSNLGPVDGSGASVEPLEATEDIEDEQ